MNGNKYEVRGFWICKINIGYIWFNRKIFNKWELMDKLLCIYIYLEIVGNVDWCKINLELRIDCIVIRIKGNM